MQIQQIQIADYSCNLFLPKNYHENGRHYPVIYINGDVPVEEIINEIQRSGHEADFILLAVWPESWNDDFTPWSAPAFRKGEEAPAGRADVYISRLTSEIKPYMDANYRTKPEPEYTALFGYSLGGLAAIYAMYKTDLFGTVASLSGSLWYDGFCEFMEKEVPVRKDTMVYLSLGTKESLSRNPRMCKVADCTEKARDILSGQLRSPDCSGAVKGQADESGGSGSAQESTGNVCFEWNEGGHFHDIPRRFAKAVRWWISVSICPGYLSSRSEARN